MFVPNSFFSDENFQIIRKLVEDVGNLFENANQSMVPQSNNHHYDDEEIRVRFQDMDKVNDICVNKINNSWWCNLFYFAPCELPHSKSVVCPPAHLCWRANSLSFFLPLSFVTCTNFKFSHRFFSFFLSHSLFIGILKKQQQQVQVTLKQFARDWSTDGEEERQQCYAPIINEIEKFYTADKVYV